MPATKTVPLTVSTIERECKDPPPRGDSRYLRDTKLRGFGVRIQPSGRGTFYVFLPGGQKRKLGERPFYEKLEAFELEWARRRAAEQLRDFGFRDLGPVRPKEQTRNLPPSSIGRVVARFTKEHLERNVSYHHQRECDSRFRRFVLPKWRGRDVREITRRDVHELVAGITEGGVTANKTLALLNTMFNWAISAGLLEQNPAHRVRKPAREQPRQRVLSDQELALVWHASGAIRQPWGDWYRMLLLLPGRRTELATMRWADLDLAEATWTLTTTKSKRPFVVPLSQPALTLLTKRRKEVPQECEWVFSATGIGPIQAYGRAKEMMDRWLAGRVEQIGEWHNHDLRRSCATVLGRLEVEPHVVSSVLNHSLKGVTNQVYNLYRYLPQKRQALNLWAEHLAAIAQKYKPAPTEEEIRAEEIRHSILAGMKRRKHPKTLEEANEAAVAALTAITVERTSV